MPPEKRNAKRKKTKSARPKRSLRKESFRLAMKLYALVEAGDPEAIDVYLSEHEAQRALDACLGDEPDWRGLLHVIPIELEASDSRN